MRRPTQNTRRTLGIETLENREYLAPLAAGGESDIIMFYLRIQSSSAAPAPAEAASDVYKVRWGVMF